MNEKEISFRTTDTNEAYVAGVKRGTGGGRESGDGGGSVVCVFLLPTPSPFTPATQASTRGTL